jgi:serine/threonine protein kinase
VVTIRYRSNQTKVSLSNLNRHLRLALAVGTDACLPAFTCHLPIPTTPHRLTCFNSDFNNGMVLEWSTKNQTYCDFWTCYDGTYKAPEELFGDFVGTPADVWAMGNNIYILLTGLYPYYDAISAPKLQEMVEAGKKPFVDDRYRNRSMVEGRLVEIMEPCWAFDPKDRVDIFEIVAHLRETQQLDQREIAQM